MSIARLARSGPCAIRWSSACAIAAVLTLPCPSLRRAAAEGGGGVALPTASPLTLQAGALRVAQPARGSNGSKKQMSLRQDGGNVHLERPPG